jgi:predicted transcriptional regulator
MEVLASYLVLSGHLSPGESFLIQKAVNASLTMNQARKDLRKSGFPNSSDIIDGLQAKKLISISNDRIFANWKGLGTFTTSIEGRLQTIVHEMVILRNMAEKEAETPMLGSAKRDFALRIEEILRYFGANKTAISERKLLQELPPLEAIEFIEWLSEFGVLKIQKKKHSRTLSLSAEGAALRHLYLTPQLNAANYQYLEISFLQPQQESWEDFAKKAKNSQEETDVPGWRRFLARLFVELGALKATEDGEVVFEPPTEPSPFDNTDELTNWISGFIPVYVQNIFDVLVLLPADTATIRQETELGNSSVSGIVSMLAKFQLARKDSKNKVWRLTKKGKKLAKMSAEEFKPALKQEIETFPLFAEVLSFVQQHPGSKIGFMDLAGYFRANGISNFNPAKSLSVLRIMEQAEMGIVAVEDESGMYQLAQKSK